MNAFRHPRNPLFSLVLAIHNTKKYLYATNMKSFLLAREATRLFIFTIVRKKEKKNFLFCFDSLYLQQTPPVLFFFHFKFSRNLIGC